MSEPPEKSPKAFISYAWTSPAYEERVIDLATELVANGIEVILDKWDLKEGNDLYAFMERMVTDENVTHVLLLCDEAYVRKANQREGGVGRETTIVTPEVYEHAKNEKFIPVIMELDTDSKPFLPAYLKSRYGINLSSPAAYADGFDRLLRLLHNRPQHAKPALGRRPSFLDEDATTGSTSGPVVRMAARALADSKPNARSLAQDALERITESLESLNVPVETPNPLDAVRDAMQRSKAMRDEFISITEALAKHVTSDGDIVKLLHPYFENTLRACYEQEARQHRPIGRDAIRLVVKEMFLYGVTLLAAKDRLDAVSPLLIEPYIYKRGSGRQESGLFGEFNMESQSLEVLNQGKNQKPISAEGTMLNERADHPAVPFAQLMQVDVLLFLRSLADSEARWWCSTAIYAQYEQPLEWMVDPRSSRRMARVYAISGAGSLASFVKRYEAALPGARDRYLFPNAMRGVSLDAALNIAKFKEHLP